MKEKIKDPRLLRTTADFLRERFNEGQRVGVINLGCARNLVDSQELLGRLKKDGHRIVDMDQAEIAVLNTCGFIAEAKQESIDYILDLIELKKQGRLKKIIVAGCLAQRYGEDLAKEFPEVDAFFGVAPFDKDRVPDQVYLTPRHFAYLKICESCYNQCRFCAIPKIKGKFVSRTMESILEEARRLQEKGVRELNIIGQDITAYGMDLYREKRLAALLSAMIQAVPDIPWIRLLYAFPAHVTDELIETIAAQEQICKYIDMPLQHISDHILTDMNRGITTDQTRALLEKIRRRIPGAAIRTTFIVGLPGETEADFQELADFVQEQRFDKMGVFVYSREEGTPAYAMPGQVPDKIKKQRLDHLMRCQQDISRARQESFIGQTVKVLIDEPQKGQDNIYLGRTAYDAPDVDGLVYVHARKSLQGGDLVAVRVTDALEYDLVAEAVES